MKINKTETNISRITTKQLEQAIYWTLAKLGTYLCFEVMIPKDLPTEITHKDGNTYVYHKQTRERVDLLTYEKKGGVWRFYELKISVADFRSKCYNSFHGHYNYYVMPQEVYAKVKDEIHRGIGVYVLSGSHCTCERKSMRQELAVDEEKLKFNFMQALSRQYENYMRIK